MTAPVATSTDPNATKQATIAQDTEPQLSPAELAAQQERLAKKAARLAQWRARQLPHVAAGITSAAGMAAWGIGGLTAAGGGSPTLVHLATAAVSGGTVGVAWLCRKKITAIQECWHRALFTAASAAAGLVTLDAVYGASWGTLAATIVAEATLGRAWRREHDVPLERIPAEVARARGLRVLLPWWKPEKEVETPQAEAEAQDATPAVVEVVTDELDELIAEILELWARSVSRDGGPLARAELIDPLKTKSGVRFTIKTVAGTAEYSDIQGAMGKVAAALSRSAKDLHPEPYPDNEGMAYLTISRKQTLIEAPPYLGPIYRDGIIPIGDLANGVGTAEVVVKDRTGVYGALITGAPGSGKSSSGLLPIAMALKASGVWLNLFCDGDEEGGSSPAMNELADARPGAGPEDAYLQLLAVEEMLRVRGMTKKTLTEDPLTGLPRMLRDPLTEAVARMILPSGEWPGVAWHLDEFYKFAKDAFLRKMAFGDRVEECIRIGRKYGLAVFLATQSVLVGDYFDSTSLRALAASRNFLAFRNPNKTETDLVGSVSVKPYKLPAGGGYLYLASEGGSPMVARGGEVKDIRPWRHTLAGAQADSDTALALARLQAGVTFDPIQALREAQDKLEEYRASKAAGTAVAVRGEPDGFEQFGEMADVHRLLEVLPELTLIRGGAEDVLSLTQLKMLAALPGKNAAVAKRAGVSVSHAEKQLPKLVDMGYAEQPEKYGPYQRTERGDKAVREAAGELDAEAERELASDTSELIEQAN